jgi:hypothetical protein
VPNPTKAKGTRWESAVRDYLAGVLGVRIERVPAGAQIDRGDLVGIDRVVVECKDVGRIDLSVIVDEAVREAQNVGEDEIPVAVVKRRRRGVEDGYAVLPLWAFAELVRRGSP